MTDPCEGCTRASWGCKGICLDRKHYIREACPPPRENWRARSFTIENAMRVKRQNQKMKRR